MAFLTRRQFLGLPKVRLTALLAGVFAIASIAFLAANVVREVNLLDSGSDETAQWSLAQAEVETLELIAALRAEPPDLDEIRLRFDILYSRITTLSVARIFAPLRETPQFGGELAAIGTFLTQSVQYIDSDDATLTARLAQIEQNATAIRPNLRRLAVTGLTLFTQIADEQRSIITNRSAQLAAAIFTMFVGLGLVLYTLDRSNQRAAARGRALQQANSRINAIFDTALDGVIVADETARVVDFSPAAETIFGVSAAQAVGTTFLKFVSVGQPPEAPEARAALIDDLQSGAGHMTRFVSRADGSTFPAEIAFDRARVPDGHIYIIVVRDISDRRKAEQDIVAARDAALASEKVKTDFLATMSHEIRTPLNGLLGNMDLLRDTRLTGTQAEYIDRMDACGRLLMRHVNDVLDITQFDAGKMTPAEEVVHLPALLDDIVATQSSLATVQQTDIAWCWRGQPVPWIMADPDKLQHILLNVVGNAVKFTQRGKVSIVVQVTADVSGGTLQCVVADTGPGIDAALLPNIFDDFVTGDTSYARQVSGSGLGLGIAQRFAKGLGGQLEVTSTPGDGSAFTLTVPVRRAAPRATENRKRTLPPLQSQSVLVVEDNDVNRSVVREMLMADGHRVTEAANGAEGVKAAAAAGFDVILMDISMPIMDGLNAAEAIRRGQAQSALSPIVALTANAHPQDRVQFRTAGMSATLTKPLARQSLRSVLREAAAPPPALTDPIVDRAHLAETKAISDCDRLRTIWDKFRAEVSAVTADLTAPPFKDLHTIAETAHRLAGTAAVFGARRLVQLLHEIEDSGRADNGIRADKALLLMPATWAETDAAIAAVMAETEPRQETQRSRGG